MKRPSLSVENLESRKLLAVTSGSDVQDDTPAIIGTEQAGIADAVENTVPEDVDGNGAVEPLDAMKLINDLNENGSRKKDIPKGYDVNGDEQFSAADVLQVINKLNEQADDIEEEPVGSMKIQNMSPLAAGAHRGSVPAEELYISHSFRLTNIDLPSFDVGFIELKVDPNVVESAQITEWDSQFISVATVSDDGRVLLSLEGADEISHGTNWFQIYANTRGDAEKMTSTVEIVGARTRDGGLITLDGSDTNYSLTAEHSVQRGSGKTPFEITCARNTAICSFTNEHEHVPISGYISVDGEVDPDDIIFKLDGVELASTDIVINPNENLYWYLEERVIEPGDHEIEIIFPENSDVEIKNVHFIMSGEPYRNTFSDVRTETVDAIEEVVEETPVGSYTIRQGWSEDRSGDVPADNIYMPFEFHLSPESGNTPDLKFFEVQVDPNIVESVYITERWSDTVGATAVPDGNGRVLLSLPESFNFDEPANQYGIFVNTKRSAVSETSAVELLGGRTSSGERLTIDNPLNYPLSKEHTISHGVANAPVNITCTRNEATCTFTNTNQNVISRAYMSIEGDVSIDDITILIDGEVADARYYDFTRTNRENFGWFMNTDLLEAGDHTIQFVLPENADIEIKEFHFHMNRNNSEHTLLDAQTETIDAIMEELGSEE